MLDEWGCEVGPQIPIQVALCINKGVMMCRCQFVVALLWRVYRVVMRKVSLLDRRVMLSPKGVQLSSWGR